MANAWKEKERAGSDVCKECAEQKEMSLPFRKRPTAGKVKKKEEGLRQTQNN